MKSRLLILTFSFIALNPLYAFGFLNDRDDSQGRDGWIYVHFHLFADKGDLEGFDEAAQRALVIMDEMGINKILIMSPPRPRENFDIESLTKLSKKSGSRIAFLGGGGSLNPMLQASGDTSEVSETLRQRFKETADRIIASGAKGFGEITAHHLSLFPSHGYESIPADHPLLLLLADIAARNNVPIDFHFDPVPADVETPSRLSSPHNPPILKENLKGFERLLSHNRRTKIVWAHAGSDPLGYFTPELVREMLTRHSNLFLSIRPMHKRPGAMVHPRFGINDDWIDVLRSFPDRFVIGTDSFVVATGYSGSRKAPRIFEQRTKRQRQGVRRLLSYLDDDLARKIGRDNAERLYRLNE